MTKKSHNFDKNKTKIWQKCFKNANNAKIDKIVKMLTLGGKNKKRCNNAKYAKYAKNLRIFQRLNFFWKVYNHKNAQKIMIGKIITKLKQ